MKRTILSVLIILSLLSCCSCFIVQGKPSIQGQVYFVDGTPGYNVELLLRQEDNTGEIISTAYVDSQGYYQFYKVDPGTYWINTVTNNSYVTNKPSAIAIVTLDETTMVENITVRKDVFVASINDVEIQYLNGNHISPTISGDTFVFTWTIVEGATNYDVEIWSTYTKEYPSKDYDSIVNTTENTITWSIDLSTLPYTSYRIDIVAYDNNYLTLASNYELFKIKPVS